jgi:hypothetical protein
MQLYILHRNCLLQQVIEGKIKGEIEVTGKKEEDVGSYWITEERRGYSHLKEEALDRNM